MAKKEYTFCPGWMDYAAVAHYTCFSERTVKEWYRKGLLPAARIDNGAPRFARNDVDRLMEANKSKSFLETINQIIGDL